MNNKTKVKHPEAKTEYRGYTLTVIKSRTRPDVLFDGRADRAGKENEIGGDLITFGDVSIDAALGHLKRNIDYWEGIEGIEGKTNQELAQYLADDFLSDAKFSLNNAQSRFLLEVADRLRRCACHTVPHGD